MIVNKYELFFTINIIIHKINNVTNYNSNMKCYSKYKNQ